MIQSGATCAPGFPITSCKLYPVSAPFPALNHHYRTHYILCRAWGAQPTVNYCTFIACVSPPPCLPCIDPDRRKAISCLAHARPH